MTGEPSDSAREPDSAPAETGEPSDSAREPDSAPIKADEPVGPSLRAWLRADLARVVAVLSLACLGLGLFEGLAALVATPAHDVRVLAGARTLGLALALMAMPWLVLVLLLVPAALAARLLMAWRAPARARSWAGLLSPPRPGFQPAAAWTVAVTVGALLYVAGSGYLTFRAITWFKEPQLTSLLLGLAQLVLIAAAGAVAVGLGLALGRLGRRWHSRVGAERGLGARLRTFSPLGRVGPALVAALLLVLPAIWAATLVMPQLAPQVPWRHLVAIAVLTAAARMAAGWLARRRGRGLGPARTLAAGAGAALFVTAGLLWFGADHEAKSVATTGSPMLANLIDTVRHSTDFDSDGYGFLLGENDCAPFDGAIHPMARDLPDNGIDEDCNGRDFSFRVPALHRTAGEAMPVPEDFRRDWNILLLTVDTVRYDHTGFGGYRETSGRDTTPNLDQLVERSVSFTFAQAPSAGTMASVPAILTSKFFHSGIALDDNVKPRAPPRLKPENLLIAEITKSQGYYNGAILSHVYFEDWGMEQGFDTYDNELGAKYEPNRVTSHDITDKIIAWVATHHDKRKWFLWAHYLDPHGHYVDHPGDKRFGDSDEDRYDGELAYTDKHIGRLLKELSNMPGADRTIVIVTSDHGDGFNEHGFINHGQALYRELLHVPLIFYVPGVPPRKVDGATTPLDIVPTVADLIGYEYEPGQFEGESLVPQIFYGKDASTRVVMAETDWPQPLRAAITSRYKLVFNIKRNLYELYDLRADEWEKRNIATRDRKGFETMKGYLDSWLERVYYARDSEANQQIHKLREVLLTAAPSPRNPASGTSFDDGRIEVLGFDTDKDAYAPGDEMQVSVYFRVVGQRPSTDFQLQLEVWQPPNPERPGPRSLRPAKSRRRLTADGVLPTSRWRPGEYIRDTFKVRLPPRWRGERVAVGLGLYDTGGKGWQSPAGPTRPDEIHIAALGELPLTPPPSPDAGAR
ncbi:sulfatase-like hydrolase/transferase [Haliangium sp.]|uniref:sulfatase-like hydrolase/transferase n=1 Tax=Haliangium sp. TaxID=2663208 RepID=UPI003D115F3F